MVKIILIGLLILWPAMSGAEPCTGSNNPLCSPIFPEGAIPNPPTNPAPSSDSMSPKRLVVTITSNLWGFVYKYIAVAST